MNKGLVVALVVSGILYGTPLLLAGLGEMLAERSGVLNLGIEGMMLVGAVCAFWISQHVGGPSWLVLAIALGGAAVAGALMASIHAVASVSLRANQIVSGLSLTILGGAIGLSSYLGQISHLTGQKGHHVLRPLDVFGLAHLPLIGPVLFHQNALTYISWVLTAAVAYYLYRTRFGLHLRAVGENPAAADAMGINVVRYRYAHTIVGGAFAGVAGATYSLAIAPGWSAGMTAGAGWIALGLVILAFWKPGLIMVGAYLFGIVASLGFNLEARGVNLPPELFSSLPYLFTIVVLVIASAGWGRGRLAAPHALGEPYGREA